MTTQNSTRLNHFSLQPLAFSLFLACLLPTALLQAQFPLPDTFNPGASSNVYALAVQVDGKIVVGGEFSALGGQSRIRIGRVNADGTLDSAFNPRAEAGGFENVRSVVVQPDGKILVGGGFRALCGQTRHSLGRLNADGALDNGFNPTPSWRVWSLALQPNGKIVVGGWFTTLAEQPRNYLGRLNADGTLDTGFDPGAGGASHPSVCSLVVQPGGKILVGGNFTSLGGQPRNYLGRLNADGSLDNAFDLGTDGPVGGMALT